MASPRCVAPFALLLLFCAQLPRTAEGQLQPPNDASCGRRPAVCDTFCPFGFRHGFQAGECVCVCADDPCKARVCPTDQACLTQHLGLQFWGECLGSIEQCLPGVRITPCFVSPCVLSPCALNTSLVCLTDYCGGCFAHFFERRGGREVTTGCRLYSRLVDAHVKAGVCPTLDEGLCLDECANDADCLADRKCCRNNCGHVCVAPLSDIAAPSASVSGECPRAEFVQQKECRAECAVDADCGAPRKCCHNGCASVCTFPIKSTNCVHFLAAVESLPHKSLTEGYSPICSPRGDFNQVQCDQKSCWCADTTTGQEILGTKINVVSAQTPNCQGPRQCFTNSCTNLCPFGHKTDESGCPLFNCQCKDLCEGVTCAHPFERCQLVQPTCVQPPCPAVPRCLVNPCPTGVPLSLPDSGVTALCNRQNQCSAGFWCHRVGFNGFGFCCPNPSHTSRPGQCPRVVPGSGGPCNADCRVDTDCPSASKCCYNGCGFSCRSSGGSAGGNTPGPRPPTGTATGSPQLDRKIGECPQFGQSIGSVLVCSTECSTDRDCGSTMKKCCRSGCNSRCVFPEKTTACIHAAISAEALDAPSEAPLCDEAGLFRQMQCGADNRGSGRQCWCVNTASGIEVPGTRVTARRPDCQRPNECRQLGCPLLCPFGYKMVDGCPQCQCRDPCNGVRCQRSHEICIATPVLCYDQSRCPPQPRCIINACPVGSPFVDRVSGQLVQCSATRPCSGGFWCNNIGFLGNGYCCSGLAPPARSGDCAAKQPNLSADNQLCAQTCRSDNECPSGRKCCFNGCGLSCAAAVGATAVIVTGDTERDGVCPSNIRSNVDISTNCEQQCGRDADCDGQSKCCTVGCSHLCLPPLTGGDGDEIPRGPTLPPRCPAVKRFDKAFCATDIAECSNDNQCEGIKKCCADGCSRRCVFAEFTTGCHHLTAALSLLPSVTYAPQCQVNGRFNGVQCDNARGVCWCVFSGGLEIPGTRLRGGTRPNCGAPRNCPAPSCARTRQCPLGFELDLNGCPTCDCFDPCKEVRCTHSFEVCVAAAVNCSDAPCRPVPRCVANVCRPSAPLADPSSGAAVGCAQNADCFAAAVGTRAHCRPYGDGDGFCCSGAEPSQLPGSCPPVAPGVSGVCAMECRSDADCAARSAKCCFNGCGFTCSAPLAARPNAANGAKRGECAVFQPFDIGQCSSQLASGSQCNVDNDCGGVQKCCFDGCVKRCMNARATSACLHHRGAVEALISEGALAADAFKPECASENTRFQVIQSYRGVTWCVDGEGMEIPGTRTTTGRPNCQSPRRCSAPACNLRCPLGFQLGTDGCEVCACLDPCASIRCRHPFHVCRLVNVDCQAPGCVPIAKCVPNACAQGEPLVDASEGTMRSCGDSRSPSCPAGHFCRRIGFDYIPGYCCPGNQPAASGSSCPAVPTNLNKPSLCAVSCRSDSSCGANGPCCFNGCGLSCRQSASTIGDQQVTDKLGSCPQNPLSNPGCRTDCNRDADCPGFQKCCSFGCGRRCQSPQRATACIHLKAAMSEFVQAEEPSCATDGSFERVQCDARGQRCWCVDEKSGAEMAGTRVSVVSGRRPDCLRPRQCAVTCTNRCSRGIRLDANGCPLNGRCDCRDPCEKLSCAQPSRLCVSEQVSCIAAPCPPVPKCKPNPCGGGSPPQRDPSSGLLLVCTGSFANECDSSSQCAIIPGETNLGFCCPRGDSRSPVSNSRIGSCPSLPASVLTSKGCAKECTDDFSCTEPTSKCCAYGCARICAPPANATNCINYKAALAQMRTQLRSAGIVTPLPVADPACDSRSGLYNPIQCESNSAACWCVDTATGVEVLGTRSTNSRPNCNQRQLCSVVCQDKNCPYGFKTGARGCPATAACECKNPCDDILCPGQLACLLRQVPCSQSRCSPVPSCESNPCAGVSLPAQEPVTKTLFTCFANRTRVCPNGFHCTGFDQTATGLCCPGIGTSGSVAVTCKHGEPFTRTAEARPVSCTTGQINDCPSATHFCQSPPSAAQQAGICCPRKSYVCRLSYDTGRCRAAQQRFYYEPRTLTCKEFIFGGCEGNLNNFGSRQECLRFCQGVEAVLVEESRDSPISELVHIGFRLSGPRVTIQNRQAVINALRSHISTYGPSYSELKNIQVDDNNEVKFSIESPNSRQYADAISRAVSAGRFEVRDGSATYRAEAQTLYSEYLSITDATVKGGSPALWGLLISACIFALVIILALMVAACILYRRNKSSRHRMVSSLSGGTYGNGIYHLNAGASDIVLETDADPSAQPSLPRKAFSTDDISTVKENSGYYSQAQYIWQNGSESSSSNPKADAELIY